MYQKYICAYRVRATCVYYIYLLSTDVSMRATSWIFKIHNISLHSVQWARIELFLFWMFVTLISTKTHSFHSGHWPRSTFHWVWWSSFNCIVKITKTACENRRISCNRCKLYIFIYILSIYHWKLHHASLMITIWFADLKWGILASFINSNCNDSNRLHSWQIFFDTNRNADSYGANVISKIYFTSSNVSPLYACVARIGILSVFCYLIFVFSFQQVHLKSDIRNGLVVCMLQIAIKIDEKQRFSHIHSTAFKTLHSFQFCATSAGFSQSDGAFSSTLFEKVWLANL